MVPAVPPPKLLRRCWHFFLSLHINGTVIRGEISNNLHWLWSWTKMTIWRQDTLVQQNSWDSFSGCCCHGIALYLTHTVNDATSTWQTYLQFYQILSGSFLTPAPFSTEILSFVYFKPFFQNAVFSLAVNRISVHISSVACTTEGQTPLNITRKERWGKKE